MQPKEYFQNLIFGSRFSKETGVKEGCLAIIDYIFLKENIDNEVSFYFEELRNSVPGNISDEDFITSVFYLTRQEIGILEQNFSAWNKIKKIWIPVPEYKNDIVKMIETNDYYNPLSGDDLNLKQFRKEILVYFNLTSKFLELIRI